MAKEADAQPDYLVTTGDMLAEWMENRQLGVADVARRAGVPKAHLSDLLAGQAALSDETASGLASVTGCVH